MHALFRYDMVNGANNYQDPSKASFIDYNYLSLIINTPEGALPLVSANCFNSWKGTLMATATMKDMNINVNVGDTFAVTIDKKILITKK